MDSVALIARRCGFTLLSEDRLAEIEGEAFVMRHDASGARLLYLKNNDVNKAFSVSFKTPAVDDTGVFHILEHSVLCGSRKFPVKEPFVNLLKSSMQTFLNAMTFPDKTMYPVASTNERDLLNLMDVYLDAVFHPRIYEKREIFDQEGWHLEVGEGSSLVLNGVVYNEMKGALSDPDSVLYNALSAALFPDTTYRFESGGTPEGIPDLTYEGFLDSHRRHYRPDNSYLTLYGDLDLETFLSFIDGEYLTPLSQKDWPVKAANPLERQRPVVREGVVEKMTTAPENACAARGFVVGEARDRERMIATDILLDAVMGSNEAPLKRALLDADIAADATAFLADALLQPFVVVELRGVKPRSVERFREVMDAEIERLAAGGLDRTLVEAALSHAEFVMRERNFGYADGVLLSMSSLAGWLYDDELATAYLRYEDAFARLQEKMEEGYFERLLRELFLENGHRADVEVVPCERALEAAEHETVARRKRELGKDALSVVEAEARRLREIQEAPDDPAALDRLPSLSVSDIGAAPSEGDFALEEGLPVACLRHRIATRGIAYAYRYFDLGCVSFEEIPYVTVLAMVLGKLDTRRHTAAELDTLAQGKLGNLSFFAEVHEDVCDRAIYQPKFVASASALSENVAFVASLTNEILLETDFSDHGKILDVLTQKRVAMEQGSAAAGHSVAMARVASYYLPAAVVREQLGGMDFYRFLKDVTDSFAERARDLEAKLRDLSRRLFRDDRCLLSFAGSDEDLAALAAAGLALGGAASSEEGSGRRALCPPEPVDKHEAFVVPSDVSFTSMGYDRRLFDGPYTGSWLVASRILSYDYLWNEVRVKGGAYGAGFQMSRPGSMRFYSYRDPRIDETIARFSRAGAWLTRFDPSDVEMEGFVVSTVAGIDAPLKPRELMRRQDGMFFSRFTLSERLRVREEVLKVSADDVRALGAAISRAAEKHLVCTVGGRALIEASKEGFNVVELLGGSKER